MLTLFAASICGCHKQQEQSSQTTATEREAIKPEPRPEAPRMARETPSLEPAKALTKTKPVTPVAPTMKAGLLMSQALQGQAQAKHDLMTIAGNENADKAERDIAIRYLGNSASPESLTIVAKQLLSTDPQIRTTAYYSLPENLRPPGYDYTALPDAAAREIVAKVVEGIKK